MKKLALILIVLITASCSKTEVETLNKYSYYGDEGKYTVLINFGGDQTKTIDSDFTWTKDFLADDLFTPSIELINKESNKQIEIGIKKNGIIIYSAKY